MSEQIKEEAKPMIDLCEFLNGRGKNAEEVALSLNRDSLNQLRQADGLYGGEDEYAALLAALSLIQGATRYAIKNGNAMGRSMREENDLRDLLDDVGTQFCKKMAKDYWLASAINSEEFYAFTGAKSLLSGYFARHLEPHEAQKGTPDFREQAVDSLSYMEESLNRNLQCYIHEFEEEKQAKLEAERLRVEREREAARVRAEEERKAAEIARVNRFLVNFRPSRQVAADSAGQTAEPAQTVGK